MATQSYTIRHGQHAQDVVQAAGTTLGTDTVVVSIDYTAMGRNGTIRALDEIKRRIMQSAFPPA